MVDPLLLFIRGELLGINDQQRVTLTSTQVKIQTDPLLIAPLH